MNWETPKKDDVAMFSPEGGTREEAMKEQVRRTGELLNHIIDNIPSHATEDERQRIAKATTLLFQLRKWRIWVNKTEYSVDEPEDASLVRAFRIELRPPDAQKKSDWIINESVEGSKASYQPYIFEHDESGIDGDVKDPTAEDMESAFKIFEESWQLFEQGQHEKILFYLADPRYLQGRPEEIRSE